MTVLPILNSAVLPDSLMFFPADYYKQMTGADPAVNDRVIFLLVRDGQQMPWKEDSFYPIGVTGEIREVNPGGYLTIQSGPRVSIEAVTIHADHSLTVNAARMADVDDLDEAEEQKHLEGIKNLVRQYMSKFQWGRIAEPFVDVWHHVSEVLATMSYWMKLTGEQRFQLLQMDSKRERMDKMESMLYEYLEMANVSAEANTATEEDYQKSYREAAIRKQIDYLQNELDEMHPENVSDVQRFEKKIRESDMNDEARREAEKMLNRMKQEGKNSPEYGTLYDYLDFVTSLSWKAPEAETINLKKAEKILNDQHYGLDKVKQRIIQQIAVMNLKHSQSGSILLFVGAPGTGKTSIASSIAKALDRPYVRVALGGVRDEADIRGHRRTYIGAMPGRIMDGISKAGASNPVMVLDEVDKLGASYNGDPASALLEVLDPEQNKNFTDHYMNVPYDLSNVMFICTANSTDTIPAPLLNRMEVIQFTGYTPEEKLQIAKKHLVPKAEESMGIPDGRLVIPDDTLREIISEYTMEAGVRGLRKRIDTLCRNAAVKIAQEIPDTKSEQALAEQTAVSAAGEKKNVEPSLAGQPTAGEKTDAKPSLAGQSAAGGKTNAEPMTTDQTAASAAGEKTDAAAASGHVDIPESDGILTVTKDQLRSLLDMHPVHHDRVLVQAKPGVVTGLAWTEVGGEILYIETLFTKGKGETVMTGQLGDVMKESAEIAVDLVKSLFPDKADLFAENDIHIHVPEGAVKKDGPSAGITLTTAISSLVTGIAVDPHVAMTGEVSLRGAVMPIGGLPEKLMAAQRAGVTHVFIPRENMEDLDEVADDVKNKLTITPVDNVTDVLQALHIMN